ncbi:hypothetical protein LUZ60_003826 [Juncus effusus]|nr:hypothetical protein LUZ60_003826 [Juncus effusus]
MELTATAALRHHNPNPKRISTKLFQQATHLCAQNRLSDAVNLAVSSPKPDVDSVGVILQSCGSNRDLESGRKMHEFISCHERLSKHVVVTTRLVTMYANCGSVLESRKVFDLMEEKNLYQWNSMISGYARNGLFDESIGLFLELLIQTDLRPDDFTLPPVFKSCGASLNFELGKQVHGMSLKLGLRSKDSFVCNALMTMYGKCGLVYDALKVFDRMPERNIVAWNTMLGVFNENGLYQKCFDLIIKMLENEKNEEIRPDEATIVTILPVCTVEGNIKIGFVPDEYTYIGLLMACNHAGTVKRGLEYFEEMKREYNLVPKLEHYSCVIDMLGRAGRLKDAHKMLVEMPEKLDGKILSSLLNACKIHGDLILGERVFEKLLELEPDKSEHYVLISNLYASFGKWDKVRKIRGKIDERGLYKDPGFSWIEIGGTIYSFLAGDNEGLICEIGEIRAFWGKLEEKIREIGYLPDTSVVLHEISEGEKLEKLRGHSEKLAISFGLLRNKGTMKKIRVFKNVRMCRDCHNAIKYVSKVVKKEIVVRDNKRFHHFKDGFCSCGDFW